MAVVLSGKSNVGTSFASTQAIERPEPSDQLTPQQQVQHFAFIELGFHQELLQYQQREQ
jgi:hypothetical protein